MQIRCPHCQVAIELVDDSAGSDLTCPKCGSGISSDALARNTPTVCEPSSGELPPTILFAKPVEGTVGERASATPSPVAPQRPPVIEAFGRFQLLKRLGGGAYGEVFWAYDPQLDRDVAIKRPHQRRLPAELAERFAREARSAAQLQHRNIVGTYEVGEVDGRPYIASEYILGTDLAALVKAEKDQNRLLPPRDIAQLCAQVAEALHVAHEAGIVHRDLKPANILIQSRLGLRPDPIPNDSANPRAKSGRDRVPTYEPLHAYLTDFGMAKRDTEAEFVMTQAGQLLGSPAYMSPEQWQDSHAVDRRTDLWAVGVILFELLTGERPFRAERDKKLLMQQILNADPPPPSQLNSQVPADLDTLCLKCLEEVPGERPVTPLPHRRRPRPRTPPLPPRRANPLPPHHPMGTSQEVVPTQPNGRVLECGRGPRPAHGVASSPRFDVGSQPVFDVVDRPLMILGLRAKANDVVIGGSDFAQAIDGQKPLQHGVGRAFVSLEETVVHQQALKQIRRLTEFIREFVAGGLTRASDGRLQQFGTTGAVERLAPQIAHQVNVQFDQQFVAGIAHDLLRQLTKDFAAFLDELLEKLTVLVAQVRNLFPGVDPQRDLLPFRQDDGTNRRENTIVILGMNSLHHWLREVTATIYASGKRSGKRVRSLVVQL